MAEPMEGVEAAPPADVLPTQPNPSVPPSDPAPPADAPAPNDPASAAAASEPAAADAGNVATEAGASVNGVEGHAGDKESGNNNTTTSSANNNSDNSGNSESLNGEPGNTTTTAAAATATVGGESGIAGSKPQNPAAIGTVGVFAGSVGSKGEAESGASGASSPNGEEGPEGGSSNKKSEGAVVVDEAAAVAAERERMFEEKLDALFSEMKAVEGGDHEELQKAVKDLVASRESRKLGALKWRDYQMSNIQAEYAGEIQNIEQDYEAGIAETREKMLTMLEEKRLDLQDQRGEAGVKVIPRGRWGGRGKRGAAGELGGGGKRLKPGNAMVPYQLKDNEILDDLYAIRNTATNVNVRTRGVGKRGGDRDGRGAGDVHDVAVEGKGTLVIDGESFAPGVEILVHEEGGNWYAQYLSGNGSEVYVKDVDGHKIKLFLSNLRNGKYTLSRS